MNNFLSDHINEIVKFWLLGKIITTQKKKKRLARKMKFFNNIYIFSILRHVFHLIFNVFPDELFSVKIEEFKFN